MNIVIDTSAIIAVILDEPERDALIARTNGATLLAPSSLHWEIGNALAAMFRRGRVTLEEAKQALGHYQDIALRFVEVELEQALEIAHQHNIYAYDAYMMACAERFHAPLLSLDRRLNRTAKEAGLTVWEITP